MAIAEPKFLAVVMEQVYQPKPQRLPARALGRGQCRFIGYVHSASNRETCALLGDRLISVSPIAKRASAGKG